jgi:hypothetical protein
VVSQLIDADSAPPLVARERPPKRVPLLVRFYGTGDQYAVFAPWSLSRGPEICCVTSHWAVPSELTPLGTREIDAYIEDPPTKKTKNLLEAYKIAKDPKSWEENLERDLRELAEEIANADEDQLEDEAVAGEAKSKKRKRSSAVKAPAEKKKPGKAATKKVSDRA